MITYEEAKDLFNYCPITGKLTNKSDGQLALNYKNSFGHLWGRINGEWHSNHRVCWLLYHGEWPDNIDHFNKIPWDNRIENLFNGTHQENHRNRKRQINNKSGVCGVSYEKAKSKYKAYIKVDGKMITLGRFKSLEEATIVRKEAEIKYGFKENHGKEF